MTNGPFFSEGRNISNEIHFTTTPARFGNQSVSISQTHKRTITDTDNNIILPSSSTNAQAGFLHQSPDTFKQPTSSSFMPFQCYNPPQNLCACDSPIFTAQKHLSPGGVTFRFDQNSQPNQYNDTLVFNNGMPYSGNVNIHQEPANQRNICFQSMPQQQQPQHYGSTPCRRMNLQEYMAWRNLQQHNLERILLQEHVDMNPFQLKFHCDGQTDTLDIYGGRTLVPPSKGQPDFRNISGVMTQTYGAELRNMDAFERTTDRFPNIFYRSNMRRLNITRDGELEKKDFHITFTPKPEEIERKEAKQKDGSTETVECGNVSCGTSDKSSKNCQCNAMEDDDDENSRLLVEFIDETLEAVHRLNNSKEVNTEPARTEEKSCETRRVSCDDDSDDEDDAEQSDSDRE